jgi:Holliday junction resolvasome RuvABC endonuclease subunit
MAKIKYSLGADCGKTNFGLGLVRLKNNTVEIVGSSMFEQTIGSIKKEDYFKQRRKFIKEWSKVLDTYKPYIVGAERYQTRSHKSVMVELVSIMIAHMATTCDERKVRFRTLIAAQWKIAWARLFPKWPLDKVYQICASEKTKASAHRVSHRVDAVLIAIYTLLDNSFKGLRVNAKFLRQIRKELP